MKLQYWTKDTTYIDESVVSVVGDCGKIMIFTADYGPTHHKYLIDGPVLKRYELTCSFYRMTPIRNWRLSA